MRYQTRTKAGVEPLAKPDRLHRDATKILSSPSSTSSSESRFSGGRDENWSRQNDTLIVKQDWGGGKKTGHSQAQFRDKDEQQQQEKKRKRTKRRADTPPSTTSTDSAGTTKAPPPKRTRSGRRVKPSAKAKEEAVVTGPDVDDERRNRESAPSPGSPLEETARGVADGERQPIGTELHLGDIETIAHATVTPAATTTRIDEPAKPKPKGKREPKAKGPRRKRVKIDESQNQIRTTSSGPTPAPKRTSYPITRTVKLLNSTPDTSLVAGSDRQATKHRPRTSSDFAVSSDSSDTPDQHRDPQGGEVRDEVHGEEETNTRTTAEEQRERIEALLVIAETALQRVQTEDPGPVHVEQASKADERPVGVKEPERGEGVQRQMHLSDFGKVQEQEQEREELERPITATPPPSPRPYETWSRHVDLRRFLARWNQPDFNLMAVIRETSEATAENRDPALPKADEMADIVQTISTDRWPAFVDTCASQARQLPSFTSVERSGGLQLTLYRPAPPAPAPAPPTLPGRPQLNLYRPLPPIPLPPAILNQIEVPERPGWDIDKSRQIMFNGRPYLPDRVQALRAHPY